MGKKMKKLRLKLTDERMLELLKLKDMLFLQHEHVTVTLTEGNYEEICRNLGDKAKTIIWEVW